MRLAIDNCSHKSDLLRKRGFASVDTMRGKKNQHTRDFSPSNSRNDSTNVGRASMAATDWKNASRSQRAPPPPRRRHKRTAPTVRSDILQYVSRKHIPHRVCKHGAESTHYRNAFKLLCRVTNRYHSLRLWLQSSSRSSTPALLRSARYCLSQASSRSPWLRLQ